jgi:hypothetical protein
MAEKGRRGHGRAGAGAHAPLLISSRMCVYLYIYEYLCIVFNFELCDRTLF